MSQPSVDLARFGFRLPAELPPVSTGDPKLDAAIAQVEKTAASAAKRGAYGELKLPARLQKPKAGDLEKILAILTPEAFDVGESTFDLGRQGDDHKEYLAAWRSCVLPRETRQGYVCGLVSFVLLDPAGEEAIRPLLPLGMKPATFARMLIDTLLACPRSLAPETLRTALLAFDNDGEPRDMYNAWHAAARAAIALGPEVAVPALFGALGTPREKAVGDALKPLNPLPEGWRPALLPWARERHHLACELLVRLPPDPDALDAVAGFLQGQVDAYGHVLSSWGHDWLVAHASEGDLARFPAAIAASVRAARGA